MRLHFRTAALLAAVGLATAAQAQLTAPRKAASAPRFAPATEAPPVASGIKSDPDKEAAGRLAAQGWLVLLDRRDWGGAWEAASTLFRKNVPLGNWMDAIPKAREPYGAYADRKAVETVYKTTLPGYPDGDYVTAIFESKFDKKPDVVETVTVVREADGRWRITGYSAR